MSGDGDEFATFVRQHSRSLYGTAYMLTGSADAAEELLQATLTMLYPKWHLVAGAASPVAYARRALVNNFVSQRRKSVHEVAMWDVTDSRSGVDVAEQATNRRLLVELLGQLSARQRAAVVMRYVHDLPDTEIAAALQCRVATVRSLTSRGLAAMQALAVAAEPDRFVGRQGGVK